MNIHVSMPEEHNDTIVKEIESTKRLVSIDIIKGLALFPMVIGHSLIWWNRQLAINWETSGILVAAIIVPGLLVFPCFLFIYGFNIAKSFSRRHRKGQLSRKRVFKQSLLFFLLALLAQTIMAVTTSPDKLLNYLFTWHIFEMFSLTILTIYLLHQISVILVAKLKNKMEMDSVFSAVIAFFFILNIVAFLLLHDYSVSSRITIPVDLELQMIIQHALLDYGTCPVVPWLLFSLAGAFTASLIGDINKSSIKVFLTVLFLGVSFCTIGWFFLDIEKYTSPALEYPASVSLVMIGIGVLSIITVILVFFLDVNKGKIGQLATRVLSPVMIISNLSLTVFFVHNIIFAFDPSFISSLESFMLFGVLYFLFFVITAFLWQKKNFKFSLEWIIKKMA